MIDIFSLSLRGARVFVSLVLLCVCCCGASAQQVMSLDECIQVAYNQGVAVQMGQVDVRQAQELLVQAWDLAPTEFTLAQDPLSGGSPDNSLSISQSFSFPTVYVARHRQARAQALLAQSRLHSVQCQVKADVATSFFELLCAVQCQQVYAAQDSVCRELLRVVEARFADGEVSKVDVIYARQALRNVSRQVAEAQQCVRACQRSLASVMNASVVVCPSPHGLPSSDSLANLVLGSDFLFAHSPQGQEAGQAQQVAQQHLSAVRAEWAPQITLAARTQLVLSGFNPYGADRSRYDGGNFMGFEVSLGLPVFFGSQRSRVRSAHLDVQKAQLEAQQALLQAQQEYDNAADECLRCFNLLKSYDADAHADAEELIRVSRLAYTNGQLSFADFVQCQNDALQQHIQHLQVERDFRIAAVRVLALQ